MIISSKAAGAARGFKTPEYSTQQWSVGLAKLRQICLDLGLVEDAKWGHACYTRNGRNIAIFGAFRGNFRLTFMNASLLKDTEGVLGKQGPNSQTAGMISFTDPDKVDAMEPIIRASLQELMKYADAGIKPAKRARELVLPAELVQALDGDPKLAEAFHKLTTGRQKSYVINLNGAKKIETKISRIAGFRDKIIAGKGALDR